VTQIGTVTYNGVDYTIPTNPAIKVIRDAVTGIQRGKLERGDWSYVIPEWEGKQHEHDVDGQEVIA
jgi:branched-chain amino acid aminotransferase